MHARSLTTLVLAVAAILATVATPATAGGGDDYGGTPFVDGDEAGYELEGVRSLGEVVKGPGVPAWLRACIHDDWTLLEKEGFYAAFTGGLPTEESIRARGDDPFERWLVVFCTPSADAVGVSTQIVLTGVLATWRATDPTPQIFVDWLIAYAYALVEIPLQIGTSSPLGDTDAPLITQLDTWLWIDPSVWAPRSATTPPVFGVTATVSANPYQVEFETSEGEYVDCLDNIGSVYDYNRPAAGQTTACSVTYRDASSVADQKLASTVRWAVTYTCSSAACPSGTLPDFVMTTSRDVRVAEIVGVGTSNGN